MEPVEIKIINTVLHKHFIHKTNGLGICKYLYFNGHISHDAYKSVLILWRNNTRDSETKTIRVINFLTSRIPFTVFHKALSRNGQNDVAHLLNDKINDVKHAGEEIHRIWKIRVGQRQIIYRVFATLKSMVDVGSISDPRCDIRRLSMTFKSRFKCEQNPAEKQKLADLYFAILLSELDNTTFISSEAASFQSLLRDLTKVTRFTTHVTINSAIILSRRAISNVRSGNLDRGKDDIYSAMITALQSETCPDLCLIIHEQANVLFLEYERTPSPTVLEHVTKSCFAGIQASAELLDGDEAEYSDKLKVRFYLKIAVSSLGLNHHGKPIPGLRINQDNITTAQMCLGALERCPQSITTRRQMFVFIVRGRLAELRGNNETAREYIKEAYTLACTGQFDESAGLREYDSYLSDCCGEINQKHDLEHKQLNI